jgi:hypothetical protein
MSRVKFNPLLEQVTGQVGDLVFKRYGSRVILARKPDTSGRVWTPAQEQHREQFRQAALYGKMSSADPVLRAFYEALARAQGKPLFSLMVADFFNRPTVDQVDVSGYHGAAGDAIAVRASDDVGVVSVRVSLTRANGTPIETGPAAETPANSGRWVYTAVMAVPAGTQVIVTATATDRPGGIGTAEAQVTL